MKNENGDLFCHSFVVGEWTRRVILRRKPLRGEEEGKSFVDSLFALCYATCVLLFFYTLSSLFSKAGNDTSPRKF